MIASPSSHLNINQINRKYDLVVIAGFILLLFIIKRRIANMFKHFSYTQVDLLVCTSRTNAPRANRNSTKNDINAFLYIVVFFFSFVYERRRVAVIAAAAANVVAVAVAFIHISIYANRAEQ